MIRLAATTLFLLAWLDAAANAQMFALASLDKLNQKLSGHVVDYTENHGADRRLYSPILGRPRDLYVYLPPGYTPSVAYPLILVLHGAHLDEHYIFDATEILTADRMISAGEIPPVIIAAPDGTYGGKNKLSCTNSLWVNGVGGRFEDHIVCEVVPFLMQTYSIRPEREAHALLGISAGGYGAMAIALKHRHFFGVVATIGGPLNARYDSSPGGYAEDFDPATYCPRTEYDPELLIATYYGGLLKWRAKSFFGAVYGSGPDVSAKVLRDNPADLIAATDLHPGELIIYINYPGHDNYNIDAQDQCFAWLAAQRGIAIEMTTFPEAQHNLSYIQQAKPSTYRWLGNHVLPPALR